MQTIRRIYFYLIAAISLIGVSWSVIGLLRLIISEGVGQGQIIGLASWLAVIIVGLPIFLFHWLYAQRLAATHPAERHTLVRQIFLYGVMAAGLTPVISNIYRLVDNLLLTLLGGTHLDYYPYNLTTGEHLAALIIWVIILAYLWQQISTDRRLRQTAPAAKNQPADTDSIAEFLMKTDPEGVRRIYRLVFSLAGLVMVTWGAVGLLQLLMELSTSVPWRTPVANLSAKLLVGGAVWVIHWLLLQRTFLSGDWAEERSVLRKLYLYLAVFVYLVMAIASGTALLKKLIELALGEALVDPFLTEFSASIAMIIVGGVFWAYHWYTLQQDAGLAPEIPRQAGVRRIYAYLVAAVGLAVLLSGLGVLLSIIVDMLTTPADVGLSYYRENIAVAIAMIVVGAPVWLLPWRAMQALALRPATSADKTDIDGESERRSIVRKIYLYLYVFLAAVGVFGSAGWFIFHILTAILGADLPDDFITLVLDALIIALLAAGVWVYHWWAIQHDGKLQQKDQAQRLADVSVAVLDGGDGQVGRLVIHHLEQTLPGLKPRAIGLTPQAIEAMGGVPLTADPNPLATAQFIVGPWQTLSSGETAAAVNRSPARKLALPLPEPGWTWAGVEQRPLDYYAQQAARGIKQTLEGEAISPAKETDIAAIVALVGGMLLFLLVIGSLLGTVLSML